MQTAAQISDKGARIRELNDAFRTNFVGGVIMLTDTVRALDEEKRKILLHAVRTYDSFDEETDPNNEHDMGWVEFEDERYLWHIDYYDRKMQYQSHDPANPDVTTRVITLTHVSDL